MASTTPTSWDVFLSFRGKDTRYGFTSHLYSALDRYNIRTFRDDPALRCGDHISDTLRQAIQESKTYIVVLSQNYASSSWCLDELVEILNCSKTMQRSVIPVFYKIDPSVVRYQTKSFKNDFGKHEDRLVGEMKRIQNWRLTLEQVAQLSGKHINGTKPEADIVNEIVDEILLQVKPNVLDVVRYPVGLNSRVSEIAKLLSSDARGVIKIGIYGMGGVGKTTLAKALFNHLLVGSFKGSCFLANVREISGTIKGLESLQQQLINDVLKSKNKVEVSSVGQGTKLIEERICSTKILVVIDDLENPKEFKSLVGPFASGSVVIITTRNEKTLDKIEVETQCRYRVNELSYAESETLFFLHAFGDTKPSNTLLTLSKDILRLAGGLPLALEVFGSYLYKESEGTWKSYIEKLQRIPDSTIQQRLIISFNALDDPLLKKMFIDIACFFIGRKKTKVVEILDTYYPYADYKVDILMKKCLLTINDANEFRMHDLLQEMGKDIARNSSQPGKHSRLWVPKEIHSVLEEHKGTEAIEGIMPHHSETILPSYTFLSFRPEDFLSFSTEALRRMSKLRFLYLNNINLTGKFERTLEDLRWFGWDWCPLKCLPSDFFPQKLVTLELRGSKLTTMWEINMVSNVFEKLKTLNMSYSYDLTTIPDFRRLPCLENLILEYCTSLKEIHISIGSLVSLVTLNLRYCRKLERLPDSICNLRSLEILNISSCHELDRLPDQLWRLTRLSSLDARGAILLERLPNIESSQTPLSLSFLNLSKTHITVLPSGISQLSHLKELHLEGCGHLLTIAELPPNLTHVAAFHCSSLQRINLSNLKLLSKLSLSSCSVLTEVLGLGELTSIEDISLDDCQSLVARHFPKTLFQIYSGFEKQVFISLDQNSFPEWIIQSSVEGSADIDLREEISDGSDQSNVDVSIISSVNLEPNLSHNYLGMILCFETWDRESDYFVYSVMTSASNILRSRYWILRSRYGMVYPSSISIVTVPRLIFRVTETDHTIKFTSNARRHWIRLLYKDENDVEDERDNPSVSALEVEEGGYPSKRLKLL